MIEFCAGVLGSPCFLPAAIAIVVFELVTIFVVKRKLRSAATPACFRCTSDAPAE